MSQLDFGLIGNCQISALIDQKARVVWCCMPRFDSPAIFASLLDEERGGFWSIGPSRGVLGGGLGRSEGGSYTDQTFGGYSTSQHYFRNTNVLITTFSHPDGTQFEMIDFAPRFSKGLVYYRPPQLMRIVRPIQGIPRIEVRCHPRFFYGKYEPEVFDLSTEILFQGRGISVFLSSDAPLSYVLHSIPFELKEPKHFVLSYGVPFQGSLGFDVQEQLDRTKAYWRGWSKQCNIPFEYQNEVIRSALALKLHIFEDTGAITAATTTSIPEGPEPGRTWDYRYCWLRDAYFVITALNRLGQFEEMENFIRYLQTISENASASNASGKLQPVYGIAGETQLKEETLSWLSGFKGYGPVRIGNAAYLMDQYDVYGEMVLSMAPTFFDRRLDKTDLVQALKHVSQWIHHACQSFELPDAGIWEFRGGRWHSVFSKLMSWAAVDRGVRIAGRVGRTDLVNQWNPIRERMRQEIQQKGWNEVVGYYTQSFGGDSPDAATLLLPAVNFVSYQDEKFVKTLEAYHRQLRVGRGVYRYRTPDDFGVPKTTFTVCSFWMVDGLWEVGRKSEARELFSSVIRHVNHLGLLSEDMDPESGELWGNFPQTYSHVGLINTAWRISQAWDDAF